MTDTKITLPESEIPTHFYNIAPDLPTPLAPPLHPGTKQPIGPEMLAPIFPMGLIQQEVSQEPMIEIPTEVRDITEAEVRAADELWLTSSGREVQAIVQLDGKPVGAGRPGPIFQRMQVLYQNFKATL